MLGVSKRNRQWRLTKKPLYDVNRMITFEKTNNPYPGVPGCWLYTFQVTAPHGIGQAVDSENNAARLPGESFAAE